jgi:predicted HicB family RNase H-like nuclease
MKLPYTLIIGIEEDNEGSCYVARLQEIPYLIGTGNTPESAIKELEINKRLKFETDIESGIPIPEPNKYSGQFHIRVGTSIHESLARLASAENVSLNQYITNVLARAVGASEKNPKKKLKNISS